MRALALLIRATRKRAFATAAGARRLLDAPKASSAPPDELVGRLRTSVHTVNGFPVHVLRGSAAPDNRPVVLYLHGGAFVNEIARQHWDLIAAIIGQVDAEVWVPIYGLLPDHHAGEAAALTSEILLRLRRDGRRVHVIGDSSGGTLALAAALDAAETGDSPVVGVTLISPWLDLSLQNTDIAALERRDPWLARPGLLLLARAWADIDDLELVSRHAWDRLDGLPPLDLWVGTRDLMLPDCRRLAEALGSRADFRYHEVAGAIHVFPLLPVPEGKAAVQQITKRIRDLLAQSV